MKTEESVGTIIGCMNLTDYALFLSQNRSFLERATAYYLSFMNKRDQGNDSEKDDNVANYTKEKVQEECYAVHLPQTDMDRMCIDKYIVHLVCNELKCESIGQGSTCTVSLGDDSDEEWFSDDDDSD